MVGIALLGAIVAPALVEALSPRSGAYHGTTAQGRNLNFRVTADGNRIRLFATRVNVVCRVTGTYIANRSFLPPGSVRIRDNGGFYRRVSPGNGDTTYTYRGHFTSRRHAVGFLSLASARTVSGGTEICTTPGGHVRWSASHR
jgi:hypothetical protein